MMELLIRVLGGLEVNCQLVLCPCLRWQIGRFLAFEDVSHRGVVAGQDFDDHRIDGYHSSYIHSLGIRGRALAYGD